MTAGLALLIVSLSPQGGNVGRATAGIWVVGLGTSTAIVLALVLSGYRRRGASRAALYGAATGITFGATAALMKATTAQLSSGLLGVLQAWQPYALCCAGLAGMFLMQNALQAGRLVAAQPGITLLAPFAAIIWGVVGFGEQTRTGPYLIGAVIAGLAMAAGAIGLARSPLLQGNSGAREEESARTG
jgi:hypothetical protein